MSCLQGCALLPQEIGPSVSALELKIHRLKNEIEELTYKRMQNAEYGHYELANALLRMDKDAFERFHFEYVDFAKPSPYNAPVVANKDLAEGKINVLTGGLSLFGDPTKRDRLLKKHNIHIVYLTGCDGGAQAYDFIMAYNEPVKKYVKGKFGKSVEELYNE